MMSFHTVETNLDSASLIMLAELASGGKAQLSCVEKLASNAKNRLYSKFLKWPNREIK